MIFYNNRNTILLSIFVIIIVSIILYFTFENFSIDNNSLKTDNPNLNGLSIVVISLERSKDRKDRLKEIMKDYNYSYFNGIDGKNTDISELKNRIFPEDSQRSSGEIGCALSHFLLWEKILKQDIDKILILEDDIIISPEFKDIVYNMEYPDNFDMIFLGNCGSGEFNQNRHVYFSKDKYKLHTSNWFACLHAYIVSKQGAKKLVEYFQKYKINEPVDITIGFSLMKKMNLLNCYAIEPTLINQTWQDDNSPKLYSVIQDKIRYD